MHHPRDACGLLGIYSNFRRRGCLDRIIVHQPVPPIPPYTFALAHRCTSPRLSVPMSGMTGSGCMVGVYQTQVPPALMVLSCGGFPGRSRSLVERVPSPSEPVLSRRDTGGETVASKNRLVTITNSRTATRTVIAVFCLMVHFSSNNARGTPPNSRQQLCRLFE